MRRLTLALILAATAGLAAACVHRTSESQSVLPLVIFATDGAWHGRIADGGLVILGQPPISAAPAEVLVASRTLVLLNSRADGGRYISLTVAEGDCLAGGRRFGYRFSACIAPDGDRYACEFRLKGCAAPESSGGAR